MEALKEPMGGNETECQDAEDMSEALRTLIEFNDAWWMHYQ